MFTNGYIQFTLGGGVESTKGILDATQDENTVMYNGKHNELAAEIKEYIEAVMKEQRSPNQASPAPSVADEIRKLKSLLDEGIVSEDEFGAQKRKLLS